MDVSSGRWVDGDGDTLFPTWLFIERQDTAWDGRAGFIASTGNQALEVMQDPNKTALTQQGGAWYIPDLRQLRLSTDIADHPAGWFLLDSLLQEVRRVIADMSLEPSVVVSVPPNAGWNYRNALRSILSKYGFDCIELLDDPLCILLTSGLLDNPSVQRPYRVLVVDLGAYDLTLTLYRVSGEGCDLQIDLEALHVYRGVGAFTIEQAANTEQVQITPSDADARAFDLSAMNSVGARLRLDRDFANRFADRLKPTWTALLRDCHTVLGEKKPDHLLLTGGLSYLDAFGSVLRGTWERAAIHPLDPNRSVATGAAIYAAALGPNFTLRANLHIGVGLPDGPFFPMIRCATCLPEPFEPRREVQAFTYTPRDGRFPGGLTIGAYYGLSSNTAGNMPLGSVVVDTSDLKSQPPWQIIVDLQVGQVDGLLHGTMAVYAPAPSLFRTEADLSFPDDLMYKPIAPLTPHPRA